MQHKSLAKWLKANKSTYQHLAMLTGIKDRPTVWRHINLGRGISFIQAKAYSGVTGIDVLTILNDAKGGRESVGKKGKPHAT